MARINLEDQYWLDLAEVAAKVGDIDKAGGNATRFLRYAQEHHKAGKYITEKDFKERGFLEALFPHFAERTPSGIRARGSDKHFGWLKERVEAGRKGGSKPKQTEANESKPKQVEASPSYSPFPSGSRSNKKAAVFVLPNELKESFQTLWDAYKHKLNRGDAEKAFVKCLQSHSFADIMTAFERMKAYKLSSGEAKPYVATFLNNLHEYLREDYGQTENSEVDTDRQRRMSV
jgi:hypothetical protein